jgi:hypothetical protein
MAVDKYTLKSVPDAPSPPSPAVDAWKDKQVVKEITPAKQQSDVSYRNLESQLSSIDASIASQEERKSALEAEMAKVEALAKPSD